MRILILSWRAKGHPLAGGAEQVTFEHAKGWVKSGHEVVIFSSYFKDIGDDQVEGVKIIRRGRQILGVHASAFFWYLFGKHPKFDLVVDEFHGIPFFTPLYVRAKKMGFIHEVAAEVWRLNQLPFPFNIVPALFGPISERIIFKLYKNIDFMTVSKSTKEDLVKMGIDGGRISIVENGVILPEKYKTLPKNKILTITYLGALSKDKGIENALRVFSYLKDKKAQFYVIGSGSTDYLKYLKDLAQRLGIGDNTNFWGFVSEKKKIELLSASHVVINPSVREGWGLVVIEAAAAGTPTIGFDVPGLRDSILDNKTGLLVKSKDPQSMAEAVITLLNADKRYRKICQQAIKWSQRFKWEISVKKSLFLIERIASE